MASSRQVGLADQVQNQVGQAGVGADTEGVPEEFAFAFGGVAQRRLAVLEALGDDAFGFAQQDGDILPDMQAATDEEGNDHKVLRLS